MALIKEGDAYFIYDYDSKNISGENISRQLSRSEVNKILSDYHKQTAQRTQAANATAEQATESRNAQKENSADVSKQSISERNAFTNSKTNMANDQLLPYDNELSALIEQRGDYIVDSFEKLKEIVNLAFEDKSKKATAYFGIIDEQTLNDIKNSIPNLPKEANEILFKEGRAYSIATTLDSIRHIADSKALTREDVINYLDRLADTILESDTVTFHYYEKGNSKIPGLLFKKNFTDGTLISFDLISHNKRSLMLQTIYMDSTDYQKKKSAKTLPMQKASGNTSETQVGQTSTDSISQTDTKSNTFEEKSSETSEKETRSAETIAIDAFARENIPDYAKLSEPNRQAIRMTIRQARAHGFSDQLVLSAARVSARSGLNIVFDSAQAGGDAKLSGNTIYIDPNASKKRIESRLLLHEGGHALMRLKGGKKLIAQAFKKIDPERSREIAKKYMDFYKKKGVEMKDYMPIVNEEIAAAYIEDTLGDINAWDYILSKEPTFSEKFLSFFRKAAKDYSMDENLSSEARKLLRTYKKLFNELSARNQGNNALGSTLESRNARKEDLTGVNSEKVQDTEDRQALPEDVDNYTEKQYNNFGWVRANDVINAGQYRDFTSKFASAVNDQSYFAKSKSGEYMIPVSDIFDTQLEGIENVIVFAKGTIESPKITRIAEINTFDHEKIDSIRRNLYESERRGIQRKTSELFRFYHRIDSESRGRASFRTSPEGVRHNSENGLRGESSRTVERAAGDQNSKVTGSLLEVVHTFTDLAGRKRNVVRVGSEYMIEGDTNSKYQPSIEAAVNAENERIIKRYSKKSDRTVGWVKRQLENDSDFLKNELKNGVRFALPEDTDTTKPKKIMTVGEVEKFISNKARGKIYSKKNSFDILERFTGVNEKQFNNKKSALREQSGFYLFN